MSVTISRVYYGALGLIAGSSFADTASKIIPDSVWHTLHFSAVFFFAIYFFGLGLWNIGLWFWRAVDKE